MFQIFIYHINQQSLSAAQCASDLLDNLQAQMYPAVNYQNCAQTSD